MLKGYNRKEETSTYRQLSENQNLNTMLIVIIHKVVSKTDGESKNLEDTNYNPYQLVHFHEQRTQYTQLTLV